MNSQELNFMMKETNRIPYPEIMDVKANYKFGRILLDSYAGQKSEFTTIMTYTFEEITNSENEEVEMFLGIISKEEMKHMMLLGKIIVKMGITPYYMSTYGNKWCSDNVKCNFNSLKEMLDFNIQSEYEAINGYKSLIKICESDNIKSIISRIIMDEQNHVQIFEMLKRKYCE